MMIFHINHIKPYSHTLIRLAVLCLGMLYKSVNAQYLEDTIPTPFCTTFTGERHTDYGFFTGYSEYKNSESPLHKKSWTDFAQYFTNVNTTGSTGISQGDLFHDRYPKYMYTFDSTYHQSYSIIDPYIIYKEVYGYNEKKYKSFSEKDNVELGWNTVNDVPSGIKTLFVDDTLAKIGKHFDMIQDLGLDLKNPMPKDLHKLKHLRRLYLMYSDGRYTKIHYSSYQQFMNNIDRCKHLQYFRNEDHRFRITERMSRLKSLKVLTAITDTPLLPISLNQHDRLQYLQLYTPYKEGFLSKPEIQYWLQSGYTTNVDTLNSEYYKKNSYVGNSSKNLYFYYLVKSHQSKTKWREGAYVLLYPNGTTLLKGRIQNRKAEGQWRLFFENQKVNQIRNYKNGLEDGDWYVFNEHGDTLRHLRFIEGNLLFERKYIYFNSKCKYVYYHKMNAECFRNYMHSEIFSETRLSREGDPIPSRLIEVSEVIDPEIKEWYHFYRDKKAPEGMFPDKPDLQEYISLPIKFQEFTDSSLFLKQPYYEYISFSGLYVDYKRFADESYCLYEVNNKGEMQGEAYIFSREGELIRQELYESDKLVKTIQLKTQ